jgi:hypothetical protein
MIRINKNRTLAIFVGIKISVPGHHLINISINLSLSSFISIYFLVETIFKMSN